MIKKSVFDIHASQVKDAYPDFVACLYSLAASAGCIDEVYAYMTNNKSADTGDVLEFIDNALGYPEALPIRDLDPLEPQSRELAFA